MIDKHSPLARKRAERRIEKIADEHGLTVTVRDPDRHRRESAAHACGTLAAILRELPHVKYLINHEGLYADDAERERWRQARLDMEAMVERLDKIGRGARPSGPQPKRPSPLKAERSA